MFRTEQIDVAVGNGKLPGGLWLLPHVILMGCKRWDVHVDSSTVGYFMNILARRSGTLSDSLMAASPLRADITRTAEEALEVAIPRLADAGSVELRSSRGIGRKTNPPGMAAVARP